VARCSPSDQNVPEIGDELATARALSELAHKLLDTAAKDIEAVTHAPVTFGTLVSGAQDDTPGSWDGC